MDDLDVIHDAKRAVWPELQKWMSWSDDAAGELESTRSFITDYKTGLVGFTRDTNEFVISSGCDSTDKQDEYTTGYWVASAYLGKGYATQATNAIIRYAFHALNAKAVHIDHYEGNGPSARVIEKLGFTPTEITHKTHRRHSNGEMLDVHKYVMRDPSVLPALEVTWTI
jgi:RimJ/RimL family protein N-acetyltransferase